ncbi:MAG: riboflavin synthase [Candidatus Kapaibacteriota bacterium]
MFTGIIEEIANVSKIQRTGNSLRLRINSKLVVKNLKNGDSVSVNGVCLTVVNFSQDFFEVDAVEETFNRTNLGFLKNGDYVNLERARTFNDRIDGHIVQGHIDAMGRLIRINFLPTSKIFFISFPIEYNELIVPKGSIAIDGISLTVVKVENDAFSVSVVPFTFENTNLKYKKIGDVVNLEFDILGKYVVNYVKLIKQKDKSILDQYYSQPG